MSFPQTSVSSAFDFTSTIKPNQVLSTYSSDCIYCSNKMTKPLMQDGSLRQCLACRKNFKPSQNQQQNTQDKQNPQNLSQPVSYKTPIFQTLRPNYYIEKK